MYRSDAMKQWKWGLAAAVLLASILLPFVFYGEAIDMLGASCILVGQVEKNEVTLVLLFTTLFCLLTRYGGFAINGKGLRALKV
jgi:hypothetical protein